MTHFVNHQILTDVNYTCEIHMYITSVFLLLSLLMLIILLGFHTTQESAVTISPKSWEVSSHHQDGEQTLPP